MSDNPIRRFTLLVLFQAQHDRAEELVVAPATGEGSPIRYKVEGTWYDMAPPPASIIPGVVTELERLAAFARRPFPKEGLIDITYSGIRLRWIIRMTSAAAGCVLTPIEP